MSRLDNLARRVMSAATSLRHDNRRRPICNELSKPRVRQLHAEFELACHRRAMQLEYGLCQVHPDHSIAHLIALSMLWFFHLHFWHPTMPLVKAATTPSYNNDHPNMGIDGITPAMKLKMAAEIP
jgi:hypothetical protein